ncbi:hypothetical protein [Nitrobacter vulgaris]|uniref:Uncharacterized protein n=1 Tax=Nitrobacter vulgaris TaxID=29421 RepID=A0A1V4I2C7_NITVU|nr:hypothetical protein [Nitrobacter vulgaris]OPH84363.1 hypothetical protein B2M20_02385 [Nitrobacter vulgaris]
MSSENERQVFPGIESILRALAKVPDIKPMAIPKLDMAALAKVQVDALAVFPEIQRRLAEQARPLVELQRRLEHAALPSLEAVQRITENVKRVEALLPRPSPQQIRLFEQLEKTERRKRVLDRIGLLPHPSTPFALLDGDDADDVLKIKIEQHYRDNWKEVCHDLESRAQRFDVDDEAKTTLAEALAAHQSGFYRAVCRLLLPEIERVARVELRGDCLGSLKIEKVIGEPGMELTISETNPPGYYALGLYERLTDHIYVKVDELNRLKLKSDPVPNRHAAIHGLIVYNSVWHSLNSIFLTDFAFQVVSGIKRLGREAKAADSAT